MRIKPRAFRVANMRHRIVVEEAITTRATNGSGQPIVEWSPWVGNEPAAFESTSGIESMRGRQLEAGVKAVFTVRYRAGYNTKMRVLHEGVYYGIVHINPVGGLRNYIELMVKSS